MAAAPESSGIVNGREGATIFLKIKFRDKALRGLITVRDAQANWAIVCANRLKVVDSKLMNDWTGICLRFYVSFVSPRGVSKRQRTTTTSDCCNNRSLLY